VTIRPYEEQDAAACRSLWAELTRTHRALYDDPSIGGDDPGSRFDSYRDDVPGPRIWVAERAGSVIGLVGLVVRGRRAELEPVVVSFDARGKSIGRRLVETAVEAAQSEGIEQIKVSPVARNAHAIAFFYDAGFTTLGHVDLLLDLKRPPEYWRPGERIAGRDFDV